MIVLLCGAVCGQALIILNDVVRSFSNSRISRVVVNLCGVLFIALNRQSFLGGNYK